jgi:diguanylate cyclase (GGDEF)-like protein
VNALDKSIDKLTGLLVKSEFQDRLTHEVQRAKRYQRPLTLLVIEVDWTFFEKEINIRASMPYTIFKQLGPIITRQLRTVDFAGRIAGETFSAMLPETPLSGAFVAADRLRSAVESYEFIGDDAEGRLRVAINVGVASFPEHGRDAEELAATANKALSMCRTEGGNKAVVFPQELYKASEVFWTPPGTSFQLADAGGEPGPGEVPSPAPQQD